MNKEKIVALIEEALFEASKNRPYIEVGDLLYDDPFASDLADKIKALYSETEEKAWIYEDLSNS